MTQNHTPANQMDLFTAMGAAYDAVTRPKAKPKAAQAPKPPVKPKVEAKPTPPPMTPAKRKKPHVAPPAPKTTGYDIVEARKTPPASCIGCGRHYNTYEEAVAHVKTCRDAARWRRKNGVE